MTESRLRHLPVMDGDQLIGLISIDDLIKATISEQQFIIEQLEHYIHGSGTDARWRRHGCRRHARPRQD